MPQRARLNDEKPEKPFAIGKTPDSLTDGPFSTLQEAYDNGGTLDDIIWRLQDGYEPVPIRAWDVRRGEWTKNFRYVPPEPQTDKPQPVSNDVDLGWFESRLAIDKNALDEAFIEQAELLQKVSSRLALAISLRDEAKDQIKQTEARLFLEIRDRTPDGSKAPSQKVIEMMVDEHPSRAKAVKRHVTMVHDAATWDGMFEAYKARGYALTELNKLFLAGYFSNSSSTAGAHTAHAQRGEEAREARRQAYRDRNESR
jgi:hypothetical protein